MKWVPITKYGWDQTDAKVKIYITSGIDGIQENPANVTCEFEDKCFDLRIQDLGGKNLRLKVPTLQNEISLSESSFKVGKNKATITLKKSTKENWTDLHTKK